MCYNDIKTSGGVDMSNKVYTLDEIVKVINTLVKNNYPQIKKILLFGSYARGEQSYFSDIDLYVSDSPDFVRLKTIGFASALKEKLNKDIDLFIEKNVDKQSSFYNNIIKDGVVIYG